MKRDREEDDASEEEKREQEDDASETPPPKRQKVPLDESEILQDLQKGLMSGESINAQLLETQKQYFTMYMAKLMHELPMGQAIIETVKKSGQAQDFMYMYTASKTIVQSLMSVKQHKAMKSIVDMVAGVACRYVHDRVVTPMLKTVIRDDHLKRAFHAYQSSVRQDENENELEMRCLLHTIHQVLEEENYSIKLVNPFQTQMTQQMKAISDYVVTLLLSLSSGGNPAGGEGTTLAGSEGTRAGTSGGRAPVARTKA